MIAPELTATIRRLHYAEHWPLHTIAAQLGVHHETVQHAVNRDPLVQPGLRLRPSQLDPYKPFVLTTLEQYPRLRATRLWQMLRARGYPGSARQVRHYVRTVRPRPVGEAFLRLTTLPGEQGQVDWAHFGVLPIGHARRPLWCFLLVLAWSRALFARFCLEQTLESFLRAHVLAFETLGGIPRVLLYDNLKSVVLERVGDHIRFHPRLLEFAGHYHFAPQPCAVARGNEKGRVERTIRYLRDSFFAARHFTSVDDLNAQLATWVAETAHTRPCPGDPERRPVALALEEERPRLLPVPAHPFPCELVRPVVSGKTPYVRFDGNDYSIPYRFVRRPVTLVVSDTLVRVLDGATDLARHPRSWDRGQVLEAADHLAELAAAKRHAQDLRGRDRLRHACAHAAPFIQELARRDLPVISHTHTLLRLLDRYGAADLEAALADALARGAVSAHSVAHLLDQRARARRTPPPLDVVLPDDPRVRALRVHPHRLADYDALLAPPPPALEVPDEPPA
jgi:transposase